MNSPPMAVIESVQRIHDADMVPTAALEEDESEEEAPTPHKIIFRGICSSQDEDEDVLEEEVIEEEESIAESPVETPKKRKRSDEKESKKKSKKSKSK
jgi:hypothetical protein